MKHVAYVGFYADGTYQAILAKEIYEPDCLVDDPRLESIEHSKSSKDLNEIQNTVALMQQADKTLEVFFTPIEIILGWLPIHKSLVIKRQRQVSIMKYRRKRI